MHFFYYFFKLVFGENSIFNSPDMVESEFIIKEECIHTTFYMMVEDMHRMFKNT